MTSDGSWAPTSSSSTPRSQISRRYGAGAGIAEATQRDLSFGAGIVVTGVRDGAERR